jgi:replicative DNA helicase
MNDGQNYGVPRSSDRGVGNDIILECEFALLGILLTSPNAAKRVMGLCRGSQFLDPIIGALFDDAMKLAEANKSVSPHTMRAADPMSAAAHPDGVKLMIRAAAAAPPPTNAVDYCRQIAEAHTRREAFGMFDLAIDRLETSAHIQGTTTQALSEVIGALSTLAKGESQMVDVGVIMDRLLAGLDEPLEVYPTGLARLDKAMGGGLVAGKLYGLAARMKHGKTAMLGTISYNLTDRDAPVPHLYIPLEMGSGELVQRAIARHAGFNSIRFLEGADPTFLRESIIKAKADLADRGLYFQPSHRMGVENLRGLIIRAALSGKIKGIIIDYLQLVTGQQRGQSMADHYDTVVQTLVETAKEYGLWVLMAAQLNRDGEVRGGDGLLNACDMTLYQHKIDSEVYQDGGGTWRYSEGKDAGNALPTSPEQAGLRTFAGAWLEMRATRYTRSVNIGNPTKPSYRFVDVAGPYIEELQS